MLAQIFSAEVEIESESIVLLLNMDFAVDTRSIQGYVTFLMDVDSVAQFKANIQTFLGMY